MGYARNGDGACHIQRKIRRNARHRETKVSEDRGVKIESGWLAVLRASGGQSFAAAAGLGLFLWCNHRGWMPPLSPWMIQAASLGMCIFTCLFA
ncbi:hypothetical protein SCB29_13825 [Paraburkholderia sp. SIMBA_055]